MFALTVLRLEQDYVLVNYVCERPLPYLLHNDPSHLPEDKVIPVILNTVEGRSSAVPSYEAISEGCHSEQKYLDCKEASLR